MRHIQVVGTSKPQDFQVLSDGAPLNGSTWTIAIEFRLTGLSAAQLSGVSQVTVAWLDAALGKVRASGVEFLPLGTYYFRFVITDGSGKDAYADSDAGADEWRVVRV